jgi:hypothetical protein
MQDASAVRARLQIEDKLLLEASQPWVEAPSALLLPSGGRTFEVKVPSPVSCCPRISCWVIMPGPSV